MNGRRALVDSLTGIRLAALLVLCIIGAHISVKLWEIIITLAVISDIADGWVARRLDISTTYGVALDATVDKIFILGCLALLCALGELHQFPPVAVIAAEVAGLGLLGVELSHRGAATRGPLHVARGVLLYAALLARPISLSLVADLLWAGCTVSTLHFAHSLISLRGGMRR